jgi:hypothetical protein
MAKQVNVTGAQKAAARMIVQRSAARGKPVSTTVRKIADAPVKVVPAPGSDSKVARGA